jgi:ribonuclease P protein component
MREAHLPAEQSQAQEDTRIPCADADPRRARRRARAAGSRPEAARRLTSRIRDRATFTALARTRPTRRGPLSLRALPGSGQGPARVAYAIGRHTGNAVERNRVRRRLRAAVHDHAAELAPGAAYLFGASRGAMTMPYEELAASVAVLLRSPG